MNTSLKATVKENDTTVSSESNSTSKDESHKKKLRRIELQTYGVCLLVLCLSATSTTFGVTGVNEDKYLGADLNYAGRRRMISTELSLMARECFVGDGAIYERETCVREAKRLNEYMRDIHIGLKHGNSSMRLKGSDGRYAAQDDLMYKERCLDVTRCGGEREDIRFGREVVENGLDALTDFFMDEVAVVLHDIDRLMNEESSTFTQPSYDMERYRESDDAFFVDYIFTRDLATGLGRSVSLYEKETNESFQDSMNIQVIIFSVNLSLLLVMYIFLLYPLMQRLKNQSFLTLHLLEIIPSDIIQSHVELKAHLTLQDSDSLLSIAIDGNQNEIEMNEEREAVEVDIQQQ